MNKTIIIFLLLLGAIATTARAQQAERKAGEGQSIRQRLFSDYDQATAKIRAQQARTAKPKEATITSSQALRQHIFPGSNGSGSGVPRNLNTGARKATTQAQAAAGKIPSNQSASEAAQQAKSADASKAAPKAFDPAAQGKEPPLHYEKPKATTPKN